MPISHRTATSPIVIITVFAVTAMAQPLVVTATGDPRIDIPAVQAAVDQGGQIILMGHFSFDAAPTTPAGKTYARMVTISNEVLISGKPDDEGEIPTIEGGNWPFMADAPGAHVTIQ